MLTSLLRSVASVLLADTARGRMARLVLRGFIVGDDELQAPDVPQLPRVGAVSDSPATREHAPAKIKPVLADDWPATAAAIRVRLSEQGVTQQALARRLGVAKTQVNKAIGPGARAPSEALRNKLRAWVEGPTDPPAAPNSPKVAELPALTLIQAERDRLSGYLGLASDGDLRRQFQATRDVVEAAASGQTLAAEIIGKVRQGLANGAGGH